MPVDIEFINRLQEPIQLVQTQNNVPSQQLATISPEYVNELSYHIIKTSLFFSASFSVQLQNGWAGNFRYGFGGSGITLFEISVKTDDENVYYSLSVIDGFNVPMKLHAPDGFVDF